jgi:hypothetical protein
VRESGHDKAQLPARHSPQHFLHTPNFFVDLSALSSQIQAKIRRHLIVAAPRSVQLASNRADELVKPALDRHVNIFVL